MRRNLDFLRKIEFDLNNKSYVALYDTKSVSETVIINLIRNQVFDDNRFCVMTKKQFQNVFREE